jgi:hypothetical protein
MSVAAKVNRRDVTGSSFSFTIESDEDEEWIAPARRGGMPTRVIKRARVFDVGPVTFPAYEQAEVSARSLAKADELSATERRAVTDTSDTVGVTLVLNIDGREVSRSIMPHLPARLTLVEDAPAPVVAETKTPEQIALESARAKIALARAKAV